VDAPDRALKGRRVVLCFDAGREIGHGHRVRSLAVGAELAARGARVSVLTPYAGALPFPREPGTYTGTLGPADALAALAEPPAVVLADLYRPPQAAVDALARGPWTLALIDDENDLAFDADVLVNPALDPTFVQRVSPRTRYLSGPPYILLRPDFTDPPPFAVAPEVQRILVCFGGSDPPDGTRRALRALAAVPAREIEVALGPSYAAPDELERLAAQDPRVTVRRAPPDVARLMAAADAGVLAAGTLAYETLAVGLPAVLVPLNAPQEREALEIQRLGAAVVLPLDEHLAALPAALAGLTAARRAELSRRARALVDGRGVARVADAVAHAVQP